MFGVSLGLLPVVLVLAVAVFFSSGVRVVRPTSRGLVERLGRYHRLAAPGFHWIIPGVDLGNAQLLRRLITLENSLAANTKLVLPSNADLVNTIGDMGGILPLGRPPRRGEVHPAAHRHDRRPAGPPLRRTERSLTWPPRTSSSISRRATPSSAA